jgi:hypothetical protein
MSRITVLQQLSYSSYLSLANYSTTIPKNETPLKEVKMQLAKDLKAAMMAAHRS